MRSALLFVVLLFQGIGAESNLWLGVEQHPTPLRAGDVHLSAAQKNSVRATLKNRNHLWNCAFEDPESEWVQELRFNAISLSDNHKTILVGAGPGCARGGQGANGAMWIVQVGNRRVAVLASPAQDFNGWLYSVQPSSHKGYKDVVLAWHMNAREASLSYFRFDGIQYRKISGAIIRWDDSGHGIITADEK